MITSAKWAITTTASTPLENFAVTTATDYVSGIFDLKKAGYMDGGAQLYLYVYRTGTYTKNALTNVRVKLQTAAAASTDPVVYNSTLTSPVEAIGVDCAVAAIDASPVLCDIPLPPGLKRYIGVTFTTTGAATALTLKATIHT